MKRENQTKNEGNNWNKVCLVSEFPPPPGGMAVQAALLVDKLQGEGIPVVTVKTNQTVPQFLLIDKLATLYRFFKYLRKLIPAVYKSEIIHVFSHSYVSFFLFTYPVFLFSKLFGKQYVIHYHGGGAEGFLDKWNFFIKCVFNNAAVLIVPSGFLQEVFSKFGYGAIIIPNIIEISQTKFKIRKIKNPTVVITRHLEKVYNVECAVRAFAIMQRKYPKAHMTILGDGSERKKLENLVKEMRLEKNIVFTGNVKNDEIFNYLAESNIFLNSSNFDNQPVAILEAFAVGLPVVSTNAGGIPHMVAHGENGLLADVNNHEMLAERMVALIEDPDLVNKLVKNGRERLKDFYWENIRLKYFSIYKKAN